MRNLKRTTFLLLFASLFWMSWNYTAEITTTTSSVICIVELGSNFSIELGDTVEISAITNCSPDEIVELSWSPMTNLTCLDAKCLTISVAPLASQCYTITINWPDGCVSTDAICVSVLNEDCNPGPYTESKIESITPQTIDDTALIALEIERVQFVQIDLVNNEEVLYSIWEGWLSPGLRNIDLDFSAVPSGAYELRSRMHPEDQFINITIN